MGHRESAWLATNAGRAMGASAFKPALFVTTFLVEGDQAATVGGLDRPADPSFEVAAELGSSTCARGSATVRSKVNARSYGSRERVRIQRWSSSSLRASFTSSHQYG